MGFVGPAVAVCVTVKSNRYVKRFALAGINVEARFASVFVDIYHLQKLAAACWHHYWLWLGCICPSANHRPTKKIMSGRRMERDLSAARDSRREEGPPAMLVRNIHTKRSYSLIKISSHHAHIFGIDLR